MVCETQLRPVQAENSPLQQPGELSSGTQPALGHQAVYTCHPQFLIQSHSLAQALVWFSLGLESLPEGGCLQGLQEAVCSILGEEELGPITQL